MRIASKRLTPLSIALATACGSGAYAAEPWPIPDAPLNFTAQTRAEHAPHARRLPHGGTRDAAAQPAGGTLPVTSCLDDGSAGTLRSVLGNAPGGFTLDLSGLNCSVITLTQGELQIGTSGIHIVGPEPAAPGDRPAFTINADYRGRAFTITDDVGTTYLRNLRIVNGAQHGDDYAFGGCVFAQNRLYTDDVDFDNCAVSGNYAIGGAVAVGGALQMHDSRVTGSRAVATTQPGGTRPGRVAVGGGVYSYGDLLLVSSTISGNEARLGVNGNGTANSYTGGGGVGTTPFYSDRTILIDGSTISANRSEHQGGGIEAHSNVTVRNSTISGNSAGFAGGIEAQNAALTLQNSTIAFNSAYAVGGVAAPSPAMTADSTIIANNVASYAPLSADLSQPFPVTVAGSGNLVTSFDNSITFTAPPLMADPKLLPLAANGGATQTHALAADSPAIGAGNNAAGSDFDQRGPGFPRTLGGLTDIGAYERGDRIFAAGFE